MNIFGKNVSDYKHLTKLQDKGLLDSHISNLKGKGTPLLFDSLNKSSGNIMDESPAKALGYLTNNMQSLQSEIEETLYLNYRLNTLVPINSAIPEGAETYGYRVRDGYGEAGFIDTKGTNAGSSSVSYSIRSTPILQGGIDAEWTLQEVRNSLFAGTPLQTDVLEFSTMACLNHMEKVGIVGDSSKGFTGLINNNSVSKVSSATGDEFKQSTDAADLINGHINKIIEDSSSIVGTRITQGLTIYLPISQFNFLSTKKYSTDASKTLMDYIKFNNAWTASTGNPIDFKVLVELKGAGKLSDNTTIADRMLIAFNDSKVMEMGNPIMPRIIGIDNRMRKYIAPMEYSISQLNFKHPKACLYVDGI
jgi:hypothetical protein